VETRRGGKIPRLALAFLAGFATILVVQYCQPVLEQARTTFRAFFSPPSGPEWFEERVFDFPPGNQILEQTFDRGQPLALLKLS
jgi:hypothetical protein